jgi:hypothetical protein
MLALVLAVALLLTLLLQLRLVLALALALALALTLALPLAPVLTLSLALALALALALTLVLMLALALALVLMLALALALALPLAPVLLALVLVLLVSLLMDPLAYGRAEILRSLLVMFLSGFWSPVLGVAGLLKTQTVSSSHGRASIRMSSLWGNFCQPLIFPKFSLDLSFRPAPAVCHGDVLIFILPVLILHRL